MKRDLTKMSIIRVQKSSNYSMIHNGVLNDKELSFRARGIAAFLLSKPDGWRINSAEIQNFGPEGRKAVLSALRELKDRGYLHHRKYQEKDTGYWKTETMLMETPGTPNWQTEYPEQELGDDTECPSRNVGKGAFRDVLPIVITDNNNCNELCAQGAEAPTLATTASPPSRRIGLHSLVNADASEREHDPNDTRRGSLHENGGKALTEQQRWFKGFCDLAGLDHRILTKRKQGEIAKAVERIKKVYTLDHLDRIWAEVWEPDWRSKGGTQRPTVQQIADCFSHFKDEGQAGKPADRMDFGRYLFHVYSSTSAPHITDFANNGEELLHKEWQQYVKTGRIAPQFAK